MTDEGGAVGVVPHRYRSAPLAESEFIDHEPKPDAARTAGASPAQRRQRWTDDVVEVLTYADPEATPKRARRRRPRENPNPQALLSPNDTAELQMALTGVIAAHSLHERAEDELGRTRGSLRFAWTTAFVFALVAGVVGIWASLSLNDRERRTGVAETQAKMFADQLEDARADLARVGSRAERDDSRLGDVRIKLTTTEAEINRLTTALAEAREQLSDSLAKLSDQQTMATTLGSQLAEQRSMAEKLQAERDTLAERMTTLSKQLVETQRELARLRLEYGAEEITPSDWPTDGEMVPPNEAPEPSMGVRTWKRQ